MPGNPQYTKGTRNYTLKPSLQQEIALLVNKAIQNATHYPDRTVEPWLRNANQVAQETSLEVVAKILDFLPESVDLESKYETDEISISTEGGEKDFNKLDFLASWCFDQGYNKYAFTVVEKLTSLYSVEKGDN